MSADPSRAALRLHQILGFSRFFYGIEKADAVFWPGCALMQLDPEVLDACFEILKREEPELGRASACCGQPSRYLFPERVEARQEKLRRDLRARGVKRIYTACPNCLVELEAHFPDQTVLSVWPLLARHIRPDDIQGPGGVCALHDPCPMCQRTDIQEAVRSLLEKAGVKRLPVSREKEKTRCCGNRRMLRVTDPEASRKLREDRLSDFPQGVPITSCCQGCLAAFASEGREVRHVLEFLFGVSRKKSWGCRRAWRRRLKRA